MNIAARQPILVRELRQAARQRRTPWVLGSLALTLALLMSVGAEQMATSGSPLHETGTMMYQGFFTLATCIVVIVGAMAAANGIASEHEGHTWEALLLSGLTPSAIARGKFFAAYTQVSTYLLAIAPASALCFLVGGVTVTELVVGLVLLFAVAAVAVAFGLAVSSLVRSSRGALLGTIVATLAVGPVVFGVFSSLGVLVQELLSSEMQSGPTWLPLAIARTPFGLGYVLVLVVYPVLALVFPGWFFFEVTKANLTAVGDDRSTGLRRWFAITTLVLGAVGITAHGLTTSSWGPGVLAEAFLVVIALQLGLSAFFFAGEPHAPSHRVLASWRRQGGATFLRLALGPSLANATLVNAVLGSATLGAVAVVGMSLVRDERLPVVALSAEYAIGFSLFVGGLAGALAHWTKRVNATRIAVTMVAGSVVVLPLLAAQLVTTYHVGPSMWRALAAPSPVYPFTLGHEPSDLLQNAGRAAAFVYGAIGCALVGVTVNGGRARSLLRRS